MPQRVAITMSLGLLRGISTMAESEIVIRITKPEAVVLDAFLRRFSESDELTIEDQAEQQALWNLQCLFEKISDKEWPPIENARAILRGEA